MNIQVVKQQLNETILSYNGKKAELNKSFSNDKVHSQEWKDIQMKLLRIDIKKEFLSATDKIKKELREAENGTQREIAKVKFPYSISDSDNKKVAGELQQNNATLFLMSNPKKEQVLSAIRTAIATDRIDYAFVLFETVKSKLIGDYTEESKETMKQLEEILSGIDSNGKIKEYEKDLSAVPGLKETVSSFERFISNEFVTESFIPRETILSMSQEEIGQNLNSVNASLVTA